MFPKLKCFELKCFTGAIRPNHLLNVFFKAWGWVAPAWAKLWRSYRHQKPRGEVTVVPHHALSLWGCQAR